MAITKKHRNHCYDGIKSLCSNDSCYYNPRNHKEESGCKPIPWEVSFVWDFTKRRGCCTFQGDDERDASILITELISAASQEYKKDKSNLRIYRILDLLEELKTKLDVIE
jgi:hypothetical protein